MCKKKSPAVVVGLFGVFYCLFYYFQGVVGGLYQVDSLWEATHVDICIGYSYSDTADIIYVEYLC